MGYKEIVDSILGQSRSVAGRPAINEPTTHMLVYVGENQLPLPISANQLRENLKLNPDQKTRPGESHTLPPEEN